MDVPGISGVYSKGISSGGNIERAQLDAFADLAQELLNHLNKGWRIQHLAERVRLKAIGTLTRMAFGAADGIPVIMASLPTGTSASSG